MKLRWLAMAVLTSSAWAQDMPVYYDYVENGVLKGGKFFIDPDNPVHRSAFGLDRAAAQAAWPVSTIIDNGPPSNRVDMVIVGDGYTAAELTTYANHVDNVVGSFFAEEPLAAYFSYFNVHRVDVESNQSGVDEPDSGVFKDTALDMAYDCAGIPRLLCINLSKAFSATSAAPEVDQTLAIANSTRYGGAGYPSSNLGTLPGANASAVEVALHEFGHAFADLADEYTYGGPSTYSGSEPFDANVSIYDAAAQAAQQRKWYRWLDLPNVDAFEGGNYSVFGIYRPTFNSKMRALNRPFEEVNVEQFVINMYELVSPIDDATPASVNPLVPCTGFFVTPMQPLDHVLDIQWSLDGTNVAGATSPTFTADWSLLSSGIHDVAVRVVDNTPRVRDETARSTWMTAVRQWQIQVPSIFGDVFPANGDGVADLDDVLCALTGFSIFADCPASDLFPCGGDGLIDVDDVLAMLHAFAGDDDCPGSCP